MVEIEKEAFDAFVHSVPLQFTESTKGKEYVYNHTLDKEAGHHLRILSSVDTRSNRSRADGADAIRAKIVDSDGNTLDTTPHTKRISTWEKNLREKVKKLHQMYPENVRECPECGDTLAIRSGENGAFYGCRSYPECQHTEQL